VEGDVASNLVWQWFVDLSDLLLYILLLN